MTELPSDGAMDLQTQLEELLHQVWRSEADWRLDDRIDLALRVAPVRSRPERQR
jgi:hypothetical protein